MSVTEHARLACRSHHDKYILHIVRGDRRAMEMPLVQTVNEREAPHEGTDPGAYLGASSVWLSITHVFQTGV